MSFSRRDFLRGLGGTAAALSVSAFWDRLYAAEFESKIGALKGRTAEEVADDEDFWAWVRMGYTVSGTKIYLNSGGVSPQSKIVQDAEQRLNQISNEGPSYFMWRLLDKDRENLRSDLARIMKLDPEEVAFSQNTTVALQTVVFGLDLKKGDEVILSKQDYPAMMNAWEQRAQRDGIKLVWVDLKLPSEDANALTKQYTDLFSKKTRIVHLTHMLNWSGQVLPAKQIVRAAHQQGIEVVLDAAHTLAHIDVDFSEIGADYLASSLHKWLGAPFGTGVLSVRKDRIAKLWPMCAAPDPKSDDIRKFEHIGTHSIPAEFATEVAIRQFESIGIKRKEARLRWLRDYWVNQVKDLPGVHLHSSLHPDFSGGMALIEIEGLEPSSFSRDLFNGQRIISTISNLPNLSGVRISPNVFTSRHDLDKLVHGIRAIRAKYPRD